MRIIERLTQRQPTAAERELDRRLMDLTLGGLIAFNSFCTREGRQRDLAAFDAWTAGRLPGRGNYSAQRRVAA